MSEKRDVEEGSEFSKKDQELDIIEENLDNFDIDQLQSVSMMMIQNMYKEKIINDKIRDKMKDWTFDEDIKFLSLFKNYTQHDPENQA
jgi:hypothetical protein